MEELTPEVNAYIDKEIAEHEQRLVDIKKYIDNASRELTAAVGAANECEYQIAELRKKRKLDAPSLQQLEQLIGAQPESAKVEENAPQGG